MRSSKTVWMAALAMAVALAGCKKDYFDKTEYEQLISDSMPVDKVEGSHNWTLTITGYVQVTADVSGTARVQLLTANPYESTECEILADAAVSEGRSVMLYYIIPQVQETMYLVALDADGHYLAMVPVARGQRTAYFRGELLDLTGTLHAPQKQTFFYCFESEFPQPGDWDYNDLVLTVNKEPTDDAHVVRLNVTLEAVGTLQQLAAAINLDGYSYESVKEITTTTGSNFPELQTSVPRMFIEERDILLRGRNGEAVINLFDDAHAVFYSRTTQTGAALRGYINTSRDGRADGFTRGAQTVSYLITFRDEGNAAQFTLADLDPFIINNYNGMFCEIHTFPYKQRQVLKEYMGGYSSDYIDKYSWALAIPYTWFRYPLEGVPMGKKRGNLIGGAYCRTPNTFAAWLADSNDARDWYKYPTTGVDGSVY
ncbi:MAG: LruC domain-containing protein [Prevotella sp.]|nr:LruC domain-containing protein [Prevotella sp.]